MKKIILVFVILLIGCQRQNDLNVVKVKSSQNFMCSGFWYESEIENGNIKKKEFRRVEYKMNLKKWDKELKTIIGTTLGNIQLEGYESFPICYESEFKYTFFPSCDVSSYGEKLPNSNHLGLVDKMSGKISYEVRYDIHNVILNKQLLMDCQPVQEFVIK